MLWRPTPRPFGQLHHIKIRCCGPLLSDGHEPASSGTVAPSLAPPRLLGNNRHQSGRDASRDRSDDRHRAFRSALTCASPHARTHAPVKDAKLVYASLWREKLNKKVGPFGHFWSLKTIFRRSENHKFSRDRFVFFGPGRARREQANAGLHLGARAFVGGSCFC